MVDVVVLGDEMVQDEGKDSLLVGEVGGKNEWGRKETRCKLLGNMERGT